MNLGEYKEQVGRIPYGKRLPTALYVHREGLADLGGSLGAVMLDEADQVGAIAEPGKVGGVGEIAWRPTAGAKEFFDDAVETGLDGLFEQREGFARTFRDAKAFAGLDPFLEREELPFLDEVQELFEVLRQGSASVGHTLSALCPNGVGGSIEREHEPVEPIVGRLVEMR
jgi:hypothetical protein